MSLVVGGHHEVSTLAAHEATLRAQEAARAPVILRLRTAYEGARAVPGLARWAVVAGRCLDAGWLDHPAALDLACRLAARAVRTARTTAELLAASLAASASLAAWRAAQAGPVAVPTLARRRHGPSVSLPGSRAAKGRSGRRA